MNCRLAKAGCLLGVLGSMNLAAQQRRLINPNALVVDAATHHMYVVDTEHDRLIEEDEDSGATKAIPVGSDPEAIAIDEVLHRLYVVNAGSRTVTVIDSIDNQTIATVPVGNSPYAIGIDSAAHVVFVTNTFENAVTVIDGRTNAPKQVNIGRKDSISIDSREHRAYLLSYEDAEVAILDEDTLTVRSVAIPLHAWAMATGMNSDRIYITILGANTLEMLDPGKGTSASVATGLTPCAVVLGNKGLAYVANRDDGTVTVIDTVKQKRVTTLRVGKSPEALLLDPLRNWIYVVNTRSNSVSIIDGDTNTVVGTIPAGNRPYALGIDRLHGNVYTANYGEIPFHRLTLPPQTDRNVANQ